MIKNFEQLSVITLLTLQIKIYCTPSTLHNLIVGRVATHTLQKLNTS